MYEDRRNPISPSKRPHLREEYEARLKSISNQLQVFYDELFKDEIFQAMNESPLSREFAIQRACEVFEETMQEEKEKTIERLQEEVDFLQCKLEEIQSYTKIQLNDIEKILGPLSSENERLKSEKLAVEQLLEDQANEYKQFLDELHRDNDSLKSHLQREITENKGLKLIIEEKSRDYSNNIEELNRKIKEQQHEINSLEQRDKNNLIEMNKTKQEFEQSLEEMHKKSDALVRSYNENLDKSKSEHDSNLKNLHEQHQEMLYQNKQELENTKKSMTDLEGKLNEKIKETENYYIPKELHLSILKARDLEAQKQMDLLELELKSSNDKYKEFETLRLVNDQYYNQISCLKQEILEKDTEINQKHSFILNCRTENEVQKSELERLRNSCSAKEKELEEANSVIEKSVRDKRNHKLHVEKIRAEHVEEMDRLQSENRQIIDQAFLKLQENKEYYESELEKAQTYVKDIEDTLTTKDKSLDELTHKLEETTSQLSNFKDIIRTRETYIEETTSNLKTTQKKLISEQFLRHNIKHKLHSYFRQSFKSLRNEIIDIKELLEKESLDFYLNIRKFFQDYCQFQYLKVQNSKDSLGEIELAIRHENTSLLKSAHALTPTLNELLLSKQSLLKEIDHYKDSNKKLKENNLVLNEKLNRISQELSHCYDTIDDMQHIPLNDTSQSIENKYMEEIKNLNNTVCDLQWQLNQRVISPEKLSRELDIQELQIDTIKEKYNREMITLEQRIQELESALTRERKKNDDQKVRYSLAYKYNNLK